jgi:hypothetical protein
VTTLTVDQITDEDAWRAEHFRAQDDACAERRTRAYERKLAAARVNRVRLSPEETKDKRRASARNAQLLRDYGITTAQRNEMLADQGNACAICWVGLAGTKLARVDHDHKTNRVRAILCHHCNLVLGHARDNANTLRAAIEYLAEHQ